MAETVTTGHFRLTPEQRQFKQMLERYPRLVTYWNFDKREVKLQAIDQDIGAMSHGEQIMLRFFVAIWLGENRINFDLIEAARVLDDGNLDDIRQWLTTPVFP